MPAAPTVKIANPVNASNHTKATVSGTGEKDTIAHISVDDDNPATEPVTATADITKSDATDEFTYTKDLDLSGLDDGTITATVTLKNDIGESEPTSATAAKDTRLPTATATLHPAPNPAGWHTDSVTVELSASDAGLGVKQLAYSASGAQPTDEVQADGNTAIVTITNEGETTIRYQATDNAGNVGEAKTLKIKIDKTKPATTVNQQNYAVIIGFLGGKLTGRAADSLSGITETSAVFTNQLTGVKTTLLAACASGCGQPAITTAWQIRPTGLPSGLYTVTATSVDTAGNKSTATKPVTVTLVNL